jgi:hypothetical protein
VYLGHVTYAWDQLTAVLCSAAASACFLGVMVMLFKMVRLHSIAPVSVRSRPYLTAAAMVCAPQWGKRLSPAIYMSGPGWMLCIGLGAMGTCVAVVINCLGWFPDCPSAQCSDPKAKAAYIASLSYQLGPISHWAVSDRLCLVKDWSPAIAFTFTWASVAVKLRRTCEFRQ